MENEKKLTRSSNRMIAGVCAGIAEYFGWDATLLRIVYILATFFTAFAGVIIYYPVDCHAGKKTFRRI